MGGAARAPGLMENFCEAISCTRLSDMGFYGSPFTWVKRNGDNSFIQERLERMLCNKKWRDLFPCSSVSHLALWGSDHRPLVTKIRRVCDDQRGGRLTPRFNFEMAWAAEPDCVDLIASSWGRSHGNGDGMQGLSHRLGSIAGSLSHWNFTVFKIIKVAIRRKKQELRRLENINNESAWSQMKSVEKDLDTLLYKDEKYWASRAKTSWLRVGDKNTSFFHKSASARRQKNVIQGVLNDSNVWVHDENALNIEFVRYFENLFTSDEPSRG